MKTEYEGRFEREHGFLRPIVLEALTGERLVPGILVAVRTFGDRINFHPHLHLLVTEGGMEQARSPP